MLAFFFAMLATILAVALTVATGGLAAAAIIPLMLTALNFFFKQLINLDPRLDFVIQVAELAIIICAVVLFGVELFLLDLAVEILLFFWASIQMDRAINGCSGAFSPC